MTSPPGGGTPIVPNNGYTAQTIYELQNVDPDLLGQAENLDMYELLQQFGDNLFLQLLGGFLSVPAAIGDGIADIVSAITGILGGNLTDLADYSEAQQAIINDHTAQITALFAAFDQLILQGNAIVFMSNNTYYPSAGIVSVDVIILGAGGGGGAGRWNVVPGSRWGGGGGGGGGEVHTNIPANLLPKTGDVFDGISIEIGAGGGAGIASEASGNGGGNTSFGPWLTAGGGVGGIGYGNVIAPGGIGMIPGGDGGRGGTNADGALGSTAGGDSVSPYDLHGGGGGGGGGRGGYAAVAAASPGQGGQGGISPGGARGNPAQAGTAPSSVVATGGGGGGGGYDSDGSVGVAKGGAGAVPAGGGGGGMGGGLQTSGGGNGGQGIVFVIERMS